MTTRLTVREARPGDGEGCARAWSDAARSIHDLNPDTGQIPDTDGLVEWFERSLARAREPSEIFLVAELGGTVVGFIEADIEPPNPNARWQIQRDLGGPRLIIGALAVAGDHRRAGAGTALMAAAEDRGRLSGARVAVTDTNVRSYMSLPFYESRMGYERRSAILRKVL